MMRAVIVGTMLMIGTSAWAQDQPRSPYPTKPTTAAPSTPAKTSPSVSASDQSFVTKLGRANMAEVELGKLATERAMRDDVKKFGQQMVDDHTKAGDELKSIAQSQNITWPADLDAKEKALKDKLSKLSGDAFDREYIQAMVNGHRTVANELRTESKSGKDPELKAWASKTLPAVEEHLKRAEDLNRLVGAAKNSTQR